VDLHDEKGIKDLDGIQSSLDGFGLCIRVGSRAS
jgi:hypothetical protein